MEKRKVVSITLIVLSIAAVIILITAGIALGKKRDTKNGCVLKSYGNTVALFVDDELEEVFSNIVLDTLPDGDRKQLDNGIQFNTTDEAKQAIEDYDG